MLFECFNCSKLFEHAESLAANTTELMSKTYCSRECEDTDSEAISAAVKAEQQKLAEHKDTEVQLTQQDVKQIVDGFKLRVRN